MSKEMLNRLTSASLDLKNTIKFLEALSEHEYSSTAYEALLISAIIYYARPFSSNEKKDSTHPSESRVPEEVLSELLEEEIALHEKIITLRNKAVAHAEWSYHPTGVTDNGIIKARPFSIWEYFEGSAEIAKFKNLSQRVRNAVQNKQANEARS
jgi:hypothetical protein